MFENLIKKTMGIDMNDEGALNLLIAKHIESLTKPEAMAVIHGLKMWADGFGRETFGPKAWAEYCKGRENEGGM